MENPKASLVERLQSANNVLVTVPSNPSVDQLAAAIGMTLFLNKLGKHATAVFSGEVPSTLEFLKPEETLEKNTDSLRDFIIALDKAKADKLRYKVEDKLVKIFITPYKTSLSQDDLEFSQGDFNVDVVVALGVQKQQELDQAITAHGRILHDATVVTLNTKEGSQLGSLNWVKADASSLCEMAAEACEAVKQDTFDAQIATALLTGIVAETQRFSNKKTTSGAMNMSAKLMSAGANQQLVATKLEQGPPAASTDAPNPPNNEVKSSESTDGAIEIEHEGDKPEEINIDEQGNLKTDKAEDKETADGPPKLMTEPPTLGGTLTASGKDKLDPSTDPMTLPAVNGPLLSHDSPPANQNASTTGLPDSSTTNSLPLIQNKPNVPAAPKDLDIEDQTLAKIEESVDSPHTHQSTSTEQKDDDTEAADLEAARKAVEQAASVAPEGPLPVPDADIGKVAEMKAPDVAAPTTGMPSAPDMNVPLPTAAINSPEEPKKEYLDVNKLDTTTGLQLPPADQMPDDPTAPKITNPGAPPPVPPPMMPEPFNQHMPTHGQQPLPNQENDNDARDPLAPL